MVPASARVMIMKEIDFLPQWYKSGRRRQVGYRTQYIVLGCIFVVLMVWNFVTGYSVSKVSAQLTRLQSKQRQAQSISLEFARIKSEVTKLREKADILRQIDSKINVASVLAEISFLIDEKIVLSKVDLTAERFAGVQASGPKAGSAVRAVRPKAAGKHKSLPGDVRFSVVIGGVARNGSEVAKLICRLEDSPYFCQVYPSFSQNRKIRVSTDFQGGNFQLTEFEITCYLANYRQERPGVIRRSEDI